jgi:hypothetical protein
MLADVASLRQSKNDVIPPDYAVSAAERCVPRACQSRCKPWRNVMTALPSFHDRPNSLLRNVKVLDAS